MKMKAYTYIRPLPRAFRWSATPLATEKPRHNLDDDTSVELGGLRNSFGQTYKGRAIGKGDRSLTICHVVTTLSMNSATAYSGTKVPSFRL